MDNQDTQKLWRDVLESIKLSVSTPTFNTWFSQTHLISVKEDGKRSVAEIGCNSVFVRDTIENRYFSLVQDVLSTSLGHPCDILFVIKQNPDRKVELQDTAPLFETSLNQSLLETARAVGLRPGFTFENFAVSSSNHMAHAAAEAVAT